MAAVDFDAASIYPFKTKPYVHQLTTWLRSKDEKAFAFFTEMGTGKSKMLVDTAAWLYDKGAINALVIIAPKGVYRNWSESELPTHMPLHVKTVTGIWTAEGKKADRDSLEALMTDTSPALKVLLLNVEALGRELSTNRAYKFLLDFLRGRKALVAVDESTTIKNPTATRTKAVVALRKLAPYRRILSGQPATNGPLDMYSQCAFLDPNFLGYFNFFAYKAHFATLVPMTKRLGVDPVTGKVKERKFTVVKGYKNLDELNRLVTKFSAIVKKEDCLDLPPKVYQHRHVELGPKQRKAYDQMKRLAIVELGRALEAHPVGEDAPFELTGDSPGTFTLNPAQTSTANLVITQMLRLHQILCGFIVNDAKQPVVFDEPNQRLEDLIEVLDEVSGKAVIWATYKVTVRQIRDRLAKEYGPESVLTFYGDSSAEERAACRVAFDPTNPKYDPNGPVRFVVSNRTGARGNTWTASHTAIYFSYDHDLDTHDQSQDRIHRIGQSTSCLYLYMVAPGTVEDKILKALRDKQDISKLITPSNWREWLGD